MGIIAGSVSLGAGFEAVDAKARPSVAHFAFLLSVDSDLELLATSPAPCLLNVVMLPVIKIMD